MAVKLKVGLTDIKAAVQAKMEKEGINLNGSQRFTGTFEKIRDTKLGAAYALVGLANDQEAKDFEAVEGANGIKMTAADYVVNLQAVEVDELEKNGKVAKFYVGHPSQTNPDGTIKMNLRTKQVQLDKTKFILRMEMETSQALRAASITASEIRKEEAEDNAEVAVQVLMDTGDQRIARILAKRAANKLNPTSNGGQIDLAEIAQRPKVTT